MTIFDAVGSEEGKLADLEFARGGDDVADGGRVRDGDYVEFSNMGIAAETQTVSGDIVGRRFNDRKLHAFLDFGVAAGIDINGSSQKYISRERRWASGVRVARGLRLQKSPEARTLAMDQRGRRKTPMPGRDAKSNAC